MELDVFKISYTLLGGLGIFFYGMKMMSEALQAMAGDVIRKVINSLTTNRFLAVIVGMIVTMIVQSSSVTTVMVVGFVNAGLMKLTQAIGVIFGSNIGTTITGWIISIKIGKYGLLLVGLGIFPMLFSKNDRIKSMGRVVFGVGMIFMGLETMSAAFKPLRSHQGFLDSISYFSGAHYGAYLASIMMGCVLTMVIQSSSAMLGITIALASTGIIGFSTAAALVLGENIGTTITALLASVGASVNAKRAARAHAIFNLLGVMIIFSFLPFYIDFIEGIIPGDANFVNAEGGRPNIAAHIAASHTFFNVSASLAFLPFLNYLAKLVIKITPDKTGDKTKSFTMVGNPSEVVPATAITQAHIEVQKFKEILERMYIQTREFVQSGKNDPKTLSKIREYERITDNIEKEITVFLCVVMEKRMSTAQTIQVQALIRIADELESCADYLERIATYKARFQKESGIEGESLNEYLEFMDKVWEFSEIAFMGIHDESHPVESDKIERRSEELRIWADNMRDKHLERISKGTYNPLTSLTYSDMVVALRKVRAHSMNIATAVKNFNRSNDLT